MAVIAELRKMRRIVAALEPLQIQPTRQLIHVMNVDTDKSVVRTRPLTRGATKLVYAKITFCRSNNLNTLLINKKCAAGIAKFCHANIVIGTGVGTRGATDAGRVVDGNASRAYVTINGASWAINETDRIHAMHACIRDHQILMRHSVPDKPRNVVMSRGTCTNTIVTIHTTIGIDRHRLSAIDKPVVDEKVEHGLL